jgi:hypothetical protein
VAVGKFRCTVDTDVCVDEMMGRADGVDNV